MYTSVTSSVSCWGRSLNAFFVLTRVALLLARRRAVGSAGIVAGGIGLIAALRNVTDAVSIIAAIDNYVLYVLPIWLIGLGIVLLRHRTETAAAPDR